MEFKVQWMNHQPTWESELTLKEDVPQIVEQYMQIINDKVDQAISSSQIIVTNKPLKESSPNKVQLSQDDKNNSDKI